MGLSAEPVLLLLLVNTRVHLELPVLLLLDDVKQVGVHLRQRRVEHLGPLRGLS